MNINLYISLFVFILVVFVKDNDVLKIFFSYIVVIHEMCHALMAILTGGNVISITLNSNGGVATTSGGIFPLISIAGYIGTTLIGSLLMYFSSNEKINNINLKLLSVIIFIIYLLYYKISFNLELLILITMNIVLFLISYTKLKNIFSIVFGNILILSSFNDVQIYLFNTNLIFQTDAGILARYFGFEFLAFPIAITIFLINLFILFMLFKGLNNMNKKELIST